MKRLLLSLVCCSPLLFSPSVSLSIDLVGPSGETQLSLEQYGPVSPVETLWAISSKLRPDSSVSVQQTMVAIYKTNPYAFYKGDINKIIPESILKVPSLEFVAQQTDKEAMALIRKYSANKIAKKAKIEPVKTSSVPVKPAVPVVDPAIVAENELNKEKLAEAEKNLIQLQQEMQLLNEQFIVATEATQALKLKLQPLSDEISTLSEQLSEEALIQEKLQKIIDEYRAQLDAVELPPFSGEGLLNEILRLITSSITNLAIVILSPLLLLLTIFLVISRIRSKRLLAEQEQELAESTTILMEESGQFDELLTDDFSEEAEPELDFAADEQMAEPESIDIDDLDTLSLPDEAPEAIDLTADEPIDVDLSEDEELVTSEDDPFGIADLTDDEELISSVDLDDDETSEDDPFGIGALTEDEELISSVDLDDDEIETSEDDPFGIGALTEEDTESLAVDLDEDEAEPISESEQADLDLAAEWESQVSLESDDAVKNESEPDLATLSSDTDEQLPTLDIDNIDGIAEDNELESKADIEADLPSLDIDSIEGIEEEIDLDTPESVDEESPVVDSIEGIESLSEVAETAELDIESLAETEQASELDLTDLDIESESPELDIESLAESEEATELDLTELDIESESPALDIESLAETEETALDLTDLDIEGELPELDIESLAETEETALDLTDLDIEGELPELDIESLAESEQAAELDLTELDIEDELPELDIESLAESEQTAERDLTELDIEDELPELDIESLSAPEDVEVKHDALAKQLSDVAFNEDVPLPKVDNNNDDFIDIETLLENSESNDKDEPYSELELDLGLEEFPDVVDLQESVDIDDDENGIGAQLDLARAYLEIDDKAGAKEILLSVLDESNGKQRTEIDKLLSRID